MINTSSPISDIPRSLKCSRRATAAIGPALACLLLCCGVLWGCAREEPRGAISGKVTFQGQPVTEGLVLFRNIAKGVNMTGDLNSDGTYAIVTAAGPGLVLGEYQVSVCPPLVKISTGATADKAKACPNIPAKSRDFATSGLTVTIHEGDNLFDIAL